MPLKDLEARKAFDRERGRKRRLEGYKAPRLKEYTDRVNGLKSTTPCADCRNLFPAVCMDFDHLRDKKHQVSQMIAGGFTWHEIQAEINKCEIVCANCHRIRTSLRPYCRRLKGEATHG